MNSVWSPYKNKDIQAIENVQRRATKLIPELRDNTYQERLRILQLPTLIYRRLRGDMIEMFKILNVYDKDTTPLISPETHTRTRGHRHKLAKKRSSTKMRQNYFTQRIVNDWNSLPNHVVTAPSLNSFKARLDTFWNKLDLKYNHEA